MKLRSQYLLQLLLVALAFAFVSGCTSEASEAVDETPETSPSPVETLILAPTDFVDTFEVLGTAEPIDAVEVSSDVPGRILEARIDAGDLVRRGQTLFRIDTETDEAGQDLLRTQIQAAERELARLERLHAEGLATEQQLDSAKTEVEAARDNLRQSQVSVGRNIVSSPVAGHIASLNSEAGEFANAGVPLAEIIDFSTIVVYAQVPESEIRYVDSDATVDVDFPAIDETRPGTVDRVALRSSSTSRTYTVEVHVDNEDLLIRPGMRARTHFERQTYEDIIVIPRDSILEGFDQREAMIVEGDDDTGQAMVRPLETGPGTGDLVVVTAGLEPGERLILRGHRGLIGDATVSVVDEDEQQSKDDEDSEQPEEEVEVEEEDEEGDAQ